MDFIVPQFIERETRIAGPFTFKQLVFVVTAVGLSILFYFVLPFVFFLLASLLVLAVGFALAFWKIEGFALPTVIKNFFFFLSQSRLYLWEKKAIVPKIAPKASAAKKEVKEGSVLKMAERSKIRELLTFLETKNK